MHNIRLKKKLFDLLVKLSLCLCLSSIYVNGQDSLNFFQADEQFNPTRFYTGIGLSGAAYGATLFGLSQIWYKDEAGSRFHFQDDWGGWQHMDKAGHVYTNYFESVWISNSLQWSGIPKRKAIWYGAGTSLLFQSTIEVLDGHSDRWGFSWSDMAANGIGAGIFLGQEYLWEEQRVLIKSSFSRVSHPNFALASSNGDGNFSSPLARANQLYGTSFFEKLVKDYNGQTIWASINISDFIKSKQLPSWLGISIGYGAENIYGTYSNSWSEGNSPFRLDQLSPYKQFYIGPDIHWGRIQTNSHFLNTLLDMLDALRVPLPALEVNTKGQFVWHWVLI